jgi:hypothetical protein
MKNAPARAWQANIMLILLLNSCPAMIASDNEAAWQNTPNRLDEINTIILKKEVEILSINTDLMCNQEKLSKAKSIRIALYNFIASAFIDAGVITVASTKWATISNPHRASAALLKSGSITSMIGNSILLAGLFFESANDTFISLKRMTNRASPGAKISQLRDLYRQLSNLFDERARLVHDDPAANQLQLELSQREGKILAYIKHCCVEDSKTILSQRQFSKTAKVTELLSEITAVSTAGFVGGLFNLIAAQKKNPIISRPAGIGYTISGSTLVAEPMLSYLLAKMNQKHSFKKLEKDFAETEQTVSSLSSSDLLDSSEKGALTESFNQRLSTYKLLIGLAKNSESKFNDVSKNRARALARREITNGIVGGTKLASGIMLTNAAFSFDSNIKRAHNVLTKRVAILDTTFIPGASTWMANSVLTRRRPDLHVFTMGTQNNYLAELSLERRNTLSKLADSLH